MKMVKSAMLALLMTVGITMGGCSTTDMEPHEQLLAKAAIQSATIRFVEADSDEVDRAGKIVDAIDALTEVSDLEANISLEDFEERAREEIPWHELTPQDVILVEALIEYVKIELQGSLDVDIEVGEYVELQEVLSWVREGAAIYLDPERLY